MKSIILKNELGNFKKLVEKGWETAYNHYTKGLKVYKDDKYLHSITISTVGRVEKLRHLVININEDVIYYELNKKKQQEIQAYVENGYGLKTRYVVQEAKKNEYIKKQVEEIKKGYLKHFEKFGEIIVIDKTINPCFLDKTYRTDEQFEDYLKNGLENF